MKHGIKNLIGISRQALTNAFVLVLQEKGITNPDIVWTYPPSFEMGDLSTNISLRYASEVKMSPQDFANELVNKVRSKFSVEHIIFSTAGPGFINVKYTKNALVSMFNVIQKRPSTKRVMIEFTDPNPFKQFHIGHLMSNTIGESLARLTDYQGDVGPHVAKAIYGMMTYRHKIPSEDALLSEKTAFLGRAYQFGAQQYEENPEAKIVIKDINAKVFHKSNEDVMSLYEMGRAWSLEHFEEMYDALGTKFDHYFYEMDIFEKGVALVFEWEKKGVFEKSEGAYVYHGEKDGLHTRVFITSQGFPTYEAKELGLMFEKKSREPELDQSLVITGNEQDEYYKVVKSAMAVINPEIANMTEHMSHGMMRFVGEKMSSRKGNVITGESLLEDMTVLALDRMDRTRTGEEILDRKKAQQIAVASIKYFILRQDIGKDIIFNPEQALSFEGDSGPYIQYTHARTCSLLRKAKEMGFSEISEKVSPTRDVSWGITPLEQLLVRFEYIVEWSASERAPHRLAHFVTDVARAFNHWYAETKILTPDDPKSSSYCLFLAANTQNVIAQSLYLLGIQAPEEM